MLFLQPVVYLVPEKIVQTLPQVMECIAETGVDFEVLNKLRTGVSADSKDPRIAKFAHCGMKKNGLAKKNGRPEIDKLMAFYPSTADKAAIRKVMEECDKEGKNPVDTSYKFAQCFEKNAPVKVMF